MRKFVFLLSIFLLPTFNLLYAQADACGQKMSRMGMTGVALIPEWTPEHMKVIGPTLDDLCKAGCYGFCDEAALAKFHPGGLSEPAKKCRELANEATCKPYVRKGEPRWQYASCSAVGGKPCGLIAKTAERGPNMIGFIIVHNIACYNGFKDSCTISKDLNQKLKEEKAAREKKK